MKGDSQLRDMSNEGPKVKPSDLNFPVIGPFMSRASTSNV